MKKIFIALSILFALLLTAIIVLPFVFKDKIVATLKEEVNKNLNAKVDFGEFSLSLIRSFPNFSLEINNVSVVGIGEFENDTLVYIKTLDFTIDLMSIINGGQIIIKSFNLDEPNIKAIVLENGKTNWDITKPSETAKPDNTSSAPTSFKASLKKYEINKANIIYDDRQGKMYAELKGFTHSGSGDFTQDLFVLETKTSIDQLSYVDAGVKMLNKVNTQLKADLEIDMKISKYTFKENELQLNQLILGFNGWIAMPAEDIDMDITYSAKKTEFKNILSLVPAVYSRDFESVKTSGKLALDGYVKGKYNDKTMPGFGLKLLVENAMFQYPDLPKAVKNINIDLKVNNKDGVPDHTVIDLSKAHMEMADNPIDIKMHITTPESDANINGGIKGKLVLSSVKDIIPLEKDESLNGTIEANIKMNGKMSSIEKEQYDQFNFDGQLTVTDMAYKSKDTPYDMNITKMNMNFSPKFVEVSTFDAKMGKTDIHASGKIDNVLQYALKDEKLTGSFIMNSKRMDLNEFMGSSESSSPPTDQAASKEETPMSVLEVPGNVNFTLTTAIDKLIYEDIEMNNVTGVVKIVDKTARLQNLKMNLMEGTLTMNGSYNTKDIKKPMVDFSLDISNFDIQKTAKTFNTVEKLAPIAKQCSGKFSSNLTFTTALDSKMEPVLTSLNGGGKLSTLAVLIQNFAPLSKIADAVKMEQFKKLSLNNVNLSFTFKDGRIHVEPFDIKVKNSTATVSGSTGFDQTINYTWKLEIPSTEFGGAANTAITGLLSKVKGANLAVPEKIKVNVLLGGTVTTPTVTLSLKDGESSPVNDLKDKAKEELEKKKAELEAKAKEEAEKLKQQAQDKAKQGLDKAKAEAEKKKKEAEAKVKAEADKKKKEAEAKAKEEAKKKLNSLVK